MWEHFKAISGENVVYDVVDNYTSLMEKVMKRGVVINGRLEFSIEKQWGYRGLL